MWKCFQSITSALSNQPSFAQCSTAIIVLNFPITNNEAERSFSQLKLLLSSRRSTMTDRRLNNLALIAAHRARLYSISNDFVIEELKKKPRKAEFGSKLVSVDTSNSESDGGNLAVFRIRIRSDPGVLKNWDPDR